MKSLSYQLDYKLVKQHLGDPSEVRDLLRRVPYQRTDVPFDEPLVEAGHATRNGPRVWLGDLQGSIAAMRGVGTTPLEPIWVQ